MYKITTFGRDSLGNITGYLIVDKKTGIPQKTFVGDIYVDGSFERAHNNANTACRMLNALNNDLRDSIREEIKRVLNVSILTAAD